MKVRMADLEAVKPLFQRWGRQGGKARAKNLTPEERREIARTAAVARWENLAEGRRTRQKAHRGGKKPLDS